MILGALLAVAPLLPAAEERDPEGLRNLVILDPVSVENLRIKTTTPDDQQFEQIIFAVGRVEAIPSSRAVISSPQPGQVLEVMVAPGDLVKAGAEVMRVENAGETVTLTAPFDGMVTGLHVSQGEAFRRIKNLMEITNLREVDVIARVSEHEASMLQVGSFARIRVLSACDKIFKGEFRRFGTQGDPTHGTVEAYYRLANRDLLMRPGMRAEFRIVAAERKVAAVPREAVQGTAAQRFVFVKDYELPNAFRRVPVALGQRNDRFIEITAGLMPGDEVVSTGAYALTSAGAGSVSLKAALDAAHGHLHHEDGTPIREGEEAGRAHGATGPRAARFTPLTLFFATLSILLLGLLALSRRHRPESLA